MWKNIRHSKKKQQKNNKLKMVPPVWIDEFKLPDDCCSVSDIEDYYNISVSRHENI